MAAERTWEAWWPTGRTVPTHFIRDPYRFGGITRASSSQARYGFAVGLVLAATAATMLLGASEPGRPTLCLFLGAIVASGWLGGTGPAAIAGSLSTLASLWFYSWSEHGLCFDNLVLVGLYASSALASGLAGARQRETRDGLHRSHGENARKAKELEAANQALLTEIAQRRRIEETLQKKQAELDHAARLSTMGMFAASLAHEINQPLTAVASTAETCRRWLAEPAPRIDRISAALDRVEREANRASEVVRRVRSIVAKRPGETVPLSLNGVINDVLPLIRSGMERQSIDLGLQLAPDLPMMRGDRIQLQQLFLNLVTNAMEAVATNVRQARAIVVSTKAAPGGEVLLIVRDNGPGVGPGEVEKLFEPFSSTKPDGMGLGLSICRSIAEAHGGTLSAQAGLPCGMVFVATFNRCGGA